MWRALMHLRPWKNEKLKMMALGSHDCILSWIHVYIHIYTHTYIYVHLYQRELFSRFLWVLTRSRECIWGYELKMVAMAAMIIFSWIQIYIYTYIYIIFIAIHVCTCIYSFWTLTNPLDALPVKKVTESVSSWFFSLPATNSTSPTAQHCGMCECMHTYKIIHTFIYA